MPSPYQIAITNQQDHVPLDRRRLRSVVTHVLKSEHVEEAEISVAIVDNAAIHRVNREHLRHDFATDVISFLLDSERVVELSAADRQPGAPRGTGLRIEGEVILSAEMAFQTAQQYHWLPADEALLYLVHGLLHLCGYDDLVPAEKTVMRRRERELLQHWQLTPHYRRKSPRRPE